MSTNTYLTSQIDFSTHNVYLDNPSWGPINWETIQKIFGYIEFVTIPVTFNLDFPKNHDFDDLGRAIMKILNLMCPNGPG